MNLNKLAIIGMSAIMMGTSMSTVLAEDPTPTADTRDTTVTYKVDSSYTWTIHSSINLTSGSQTGDVTVNSANIENGKKLNISIKGNGENEAFTMKSKGNILTYTVKKGVDNVNANDTILSLNPGVYKTATTATLTFTAGSTTDLQAGSYQGKVTYTATLVSFD